MVPNNQYNNNSKKYEWKRVWEYHKEADNLFHRRFSFFLVAESMLIVSFATIMDKTDNIVQTAIIFLGLVYTFGWMYVNARIAIRLNYLKNNYLIEHDPIYRGYMESVNTIFEKFFHFNIYILPKMTFLFWLFLLLYTIIGLPIILILLLLMLGYSLLTLIFVILFDS